MDAVYSRKGTAPDSGVHKPDGSIFIGGYDKEKWDSEAVQPHHKEIIEARTKNANKGQGKAYKSTNKKVSAVRRNKTNLTKLTKQLKVAMTKLEKISGSKRDEAESSETESANDKAGNSFGGKRSKTY